MVVSSVLRSAWASLPFALWWYNRHAQEPFQKKRWKLLI
jgi:hypothetical protein